MTTTTSNTTTNNASPFRPDCLTGRVALVTGGGSGICYEITKQLLLHGCDGAVIVGRRLEFLRRSSKILQNETSKACKYIACDVRDPDACQRAVQYTLREFGRLDVLVNGAAGNFLAPAATLKPKGFSTVMSIDTLGTFNMCSAAFKALKIQGQQQKRKKYQQRGGGGDPIIINISATLQSPATHYQVHASAAKAAVDSMTRSLALEWGPYNIRVVGIAPGPIADTPGTTKLAPTLSSAAAAAAASSITDGIPLGRMGTTTEIGHAAVFLCTSQYTTGDTLIVDGGEWLSKKPPIISSPEEVEKLSRAVERKSRSQAPKQQQQQQQQQRRRSRL
mmetsp:Transcript_210/g.450  ORF Transcript_210/g.450 Transcript_210/m.450 type:complete len:334 (+) Transcript_210:93-1094(+)